MNRTAIKALAKEQIRGKIGILFVIFLIYIGISIAASLVCSVIPVVGSLIPAICITPPLELGLILVYFKIIRYETPLAGDIFEGFYDMWSAFKVSFFAGLFTFLWSLLLVIPGIIKAISYSMSMYILAENKGMGALEAINQSKQMMEGHKMDFFVLNLSFLGWLLLVTVTFGIAGIWVIPYMNTTFINFYNTIKNENTVY